MRRATRPKSCFLGQYQRSAACGVKTVSMDLVLFFHALYRSTGVLGAPDKRPVWLARPQSQHVQMTANADDSMKFNFTCQTSWNGGLATSPAPKEASPHLFEHTRACPGPLDTLVRPPGRRCDPWAPRPVDSRLRVRQHRALPGCGVSAKGAQGACSTACNGCGRPPKAY